MSPGPTDLVERLLAERIGLDPASVGAGLIARAVRARSEALGLADRAEYERILLGPGDELQALVEEIVIPESWFFRDDRPFDTLRDHVRRNWLSHLDLPPLTALSLPCAGGEEPYSIAMALLELGLSPDRFRVDAVDVSVRSLGRAMTGVYGPNSFRGQASTIRARYFREHRGRFTIDQTVRSLVHFRRGNVLDPNLLADRPPFDVVFCRNLLIYFDDPARARAFQTLGRLVAEGGLLFLGHADRGDDAPTTTFAALADKGSFAYKKGPAAIPAAPRSIPQPQPRPPARSTRQAALVGDNPLAGPSRVDPGQPAPPAPPPSPPPTVAATLDEARTPGDRGRYVEADPDRGASFGRRWGVGSRPFPCSA